MAIEPVPQPSAETFEQLQRDLNHRVWEIRRNACEELGASGDPRAVPHLIRLLGDGVGAVRFSAAEALGKLGDRQAIPSLLGLDGPSRYLVLAQDNTELFPQAASSPSTVWPLSRGDVWPTAPSAAWASSSMPGKPALAANTSSRRRP